jgi:hypothetical protein
MSDMGEVKFCRMSDASVTIRVIETKEWRIRKWIGLNLIHLGFKIIGYRVTVEDIDD